MCTCAHGCPANPVWHNHINNRPLRHRVAYNSDGTGSHSGQRAEHFDRHFYTWVCTPIIRNFEGFSTFGGGPRVNWIGNVGVTACKSGMHSLGRAFDLTRVEMHGWRVDCNTSWRGDLVSRRRYVGVAAACRMHAGTVLTAWYNAAHGNHIHFDNGVPFTVIRSGMRSDTTLVQASCNLLNSAGLVIDGAWGPLTNRAYQALHRKLGLSGQNPRSSPTHARRFLTHIAVLALAGKAA